MLHFVEEGKKHHPSEAILLLHGWPTSSYLYRHMMRPLGEHMRVIAPDLLGFGKSEKDPKASFSFRYHANALEDLIQQLGIEKVHLVVHDLGGPIGLWWGLQQPHMVKSITLLNTLVYPKFSWAVKLFVLMSMFPIVKSWLSSSGGIRFAMRLGLFNKDLLTDEVLRQYQEPFKDGAARTCLLRSAHRLHINGFHDVVEKLGSFDKPFQIIYGMEDRILPNVGDTMQSLKTLVPHASVHALPECGHFLQEEKPEEITQLMVRFYTQNK